MNPEQNQSTSDCISLLVVHGLKNAFRADYFLVPYHLIFLDCFSYDSLPRDSKNRILKIEELRSRNFELSRLRRITRQVKKILQWVEWLLEEKIFKGMRGLLHWSLLCSEWHHHCLNGWTFSTRYFSQKDFSISTSNTFYCLRFMELLKYGTEHCNKQECCLIH